MVTTRPRATVLHGMAAAALASGVLPLGRIQTAGWVAQQIHVREFSITSDGGSQRSPAISGTTVIWIDDRNGGSALTGKGLTTGRTFPSWAGWRWLRPRADPHHRPSAEQWSSG